MSDIVLERITKKYEKDTVTALSDVSLRIEKGELFGLIGPDGAGKTSIIRILTTLLLPGSGNASVMGFDVVSDYKEIRKRVGYMPGRFSLYQDLTVEENLTFFATLFNTTVKENYAFIRDIYIQIEPFKNRRAGKLSGGMKQKLALCCALIHKPEILFLDEPTTGVDAVSRKEFWEMLAGLRKQEITILISTPYMDEASLCDRIALIREGHIMQIDTPGDMIQSFPSKLYAVKSENRKTLSQDLQHFENTNTCFAFGENFHLTFKNDGEHVLEHLSKYLEVHGHHQITIDQILPTIEDCFIHMTLEHKRESSHV